MWTKFDIYVALYFKNNHFGVHVPFRLKAFCRLQVNWGHATHKEILCIFYVNLNYFLLL